ncbi:hypothetical protein GA0070564_109108 [Micromonospora mirobrigensis]|uniref:Secreted protein n=2 Tax=Micromonospora mirobrigensis TaxID=262898 RepID=A0A1C5ADY8_9ACTN|nr:hypothetical protein GA0070564_109108 [Micromonospora mirobrigensis]
MMTAALVAAVALPLGPALPAHAEGLSDTQITQRDGSAFALTPDWSLKPYADALANRIGADGVATVLSTANRQTTSCNTSQLSARPENYDRTDIPLRPEQLIHSSDRFCWNAEDSTVLHWAPQGITGSSDADDDHLWGANDVMVVSWHYMASTAGTSYDKGARISMVDRVTGKYRQVLLVEPTKTSTPNYKAIPIHAGGIAWAGNYLYVTDTEDGLRVFDMTKFLWVDAANGDQVGLVNGVYKGHGYSYVLPQVGFYRQPKPQAFLACSPKADSLCFSSLTLDRSTSPDTLVVGEYRPSPASADPSIVGGRVVRYPVDGSTRQLALTNGRSVPTDAVTIPKTNVQGAQTWNGSYYLGRSSAEKHSFMYSGPRDAAMSTWSWTIGGEDLYHEHSGEGSTISAGKIWTTTEHYVDGSGNVIDKRIVFAVPLTEMS